MLTYYDWIQYKEQYMNCAYHNYYYSVLVSPLPQRRVRAVNLVTAEELLTVTGGAGLGGAE